MSHVMTDPNAQPFEFSGGEHAVLLLHGFTGSPGHMCPLGERLHQAGFTVRAIALPGHGTKFEDMKLNCTLEKCVAAVKTNVLDLQAKYKKVSVAGLSMGGDLALIAAEQLEIASVIPMSAPMKTQNKFMSLARVLAPFIPVINWRNDATRENQLDQRYDYGYACFPTRSAYELNRIIHLAKRNLFAIRCPILAVQSHGDHTISKDSLDIILGGVSSPQKASLWLKSAPHVVTLSQELGSLEANIINFLNSPVNANLPVDKSIAL